MKPLDFTASQSDASSGGLLFQAIREYQAAVDAGETPDRVIFLRRHLEIQKELSECLDNLDFLRNVSPPREDVSSNSGQRLAESAVLPSGIPARLGDFRLVREVGRGGMGIVFEAEQSSMSRRVALKVLPFASILEQKTLQRFRTEAQIAGQLVHQNIVPVYSVGCERSVHFYAMQYIDGQTLAELIKELRTAENQTAKIEKHAFDNRTKRPLPISGSSSAKTSAGASTSPIAAISTARSNVNTAYIQSSARLITQVARALDYAHGRGVTHRDIKPPNLMIDREGKIWVTDFGLAHIESGPSVTVTGDFLGTLRYMSPEQALAQRVLVDHRTDIYSLGLTLYELLTHRPAFTSDNRQELLRQTSFEEPARPRRLNQAIPADLETILLKAIEKNPVDRYRSADDFADDLDSFLADRPIRAKRPTLPQRTGKWCRRHKSLVGTVLVAMFAVLALAAAGSSLLAVRLNQVAEQEQAIAVKERDARSELEVVLKDNSRLLTSSYIDKAQALGEDGEIATGILWLARALNTVPEDASDLQRAIRSGLSAWQKQLPTLRLLVEQEESIYSIALSPDEKNPLYRKPQRHVTSLRRDNRAPHRCGS